MYSISFQTGFTVLQLENIEKYYNLLDENTTLKLFTNATNCTLKSINLYTAIKCPYTVILVENS